MRREVIANNAPTIEAIADITVRENQDFSIQLPAAFYDADGDQVNLSAQDLYSYNPVTGRYDYWSKFDGINRTFYGNPGDFAVGVHYLTVVASDAFSNGYSEPDAAANGWIGHRVGAIKVTVLNEYDAPRSATALQDCTVLEDDNVYIDTASAFREVDPGEVLVYAATLANGEVLPAWMQFTTSDGTLQGQPLTNNVGNYAIKVSATDRFGGSVTDDFDLTVQLAPKNHAPKLVTPMADQIYTRNQAFSFQVPRSTFTDIDADDVLSYLARLDNGNPLPSWINFDVASLTFSGVVPSGQRAPTEIRLLASDPKGLQAYDVFSIGIDEKTAPPVVAHPLADRTVNEDAAFSFTLPADAFTDPEPSSALSYTATLQDGSALPAWLQFDAATSIFSGTPGNVQVGVLHVKVTATEQDSGNVSDVFDLTVANVNDAPVVTDAQTQTTRNSALNLSSASLLAHASDIDPTNDVLTVVAVGAAANGSMVLHYDGSVTFTPNADFVGSASFTYTVDDGHGGQASATVSVDVRAAVLALPLALPLALDGQLNVPEDGTVVLGAANFAFSDVDGGELVSVTVGAPQAGSLTLDGVAVTGNVTVGRADLDAGKLVFTPAPDANGANYTSLRFSLNDGLDSQNQATLAVSVTAVNDAPVLAGDSAATVEDSRVAVIGNVLANDEDVDAGTVLVIVNAGSHAGTFGALTLAADGSYTYVLNQAATESLAAGTIVIDSFGYVVSDGNTEGASQLVVSISGSNDAPVAVIDVAVVAEDRILIVAGNVLANDLDADAGTVLYVEVPATMTGLYGVLVVAADGNYTYALNNDASAVQALAAGQTVIDRFTYAASDGVTSTGATFNIAIEGSDDVPLAVDDVANVLEDGYLIGIGNVLGNDSDIDGRLLSVAAPGIYVGQFGTLTLAGDGNYSYQLDNNAIAVQSLASGSSLSDRFIYQATDGIGNAEASLRVVITGTNDAPVAIDDGCSVDEDGQLYASGMLLVNDYDIDSGAVLAIRASGTYAGALGTLMVRADGSYDYELDNNAAEVQALTAGEKATDTFSYVVSDGIADSVASLAISVTGKNDGPVAANDTAAVWEDKQLLTSGNVLANDSDIDHASTLAVAHAGTFKGQYGSLILLESGDYSYSLNNGSAAVQSLRGMQVANDVFSYGAFDGTSTTAGTLTIQVSGSNDSPLAIDDANSVNEDQQAALTGNVLVNDTDADAGTVLGIVSGGTQAGIYGHLLLDADGAYSYALNNTLVSVQSLAAGQTVYENFAYLIKDDDALATLSDGATLQIAIIGKNDAPVLVKMLEDKRFDASTQFSYQVELTTFQDIDGGDVLVYSATLADGKPLPGWLLFDAATRTFNGSVDGTPDGIVLAVRVAASDLSGAVAFDDFSLTIQAIAGGLVINGTRNNDKLFGTVYNDTIDGKKGCDVMTGGKGDDIYYVDGQDEDEDDDNDDNDNDNDNDDDDDDDDDCSESGQHDNGSHNSDDRYGGSVDTVVEKAGEGYDIVYSTASYTLASNVEQLRLLGYDDLTGTGNELNNAIFGNAGDNILNGGVGTDLLQGGAGDDSLTDTAGNNLLDGGSGDDDLTDGAGRGFIIGGGGNDWIVTGTGADVIAFNRGDGRDIVMASSGKDNTLSLGHGITYADLRFARNKNNLIMITGANEQITFQDWYAQGTNHSVANLQLIIEGSADYNPNSTNKLNNRKVEQYNFDGLVSKFTTALAANSRLTSWGLSASLLDFHLGGSDTAALGGDLAYQYATKDNLANLSIASGQSVLESSDFGVAKQAVRPSMAAPELLRGLM